MMETSWPNRETRECWEIEAFIASYARLPHRRQLQIETKAEKPDYWVTDPSSGDRFGVELTSVYIDDRSVPDDHIPEREGLVPIPYDREQIELYKGRLVQAVREKVEKARRGYDTRSPLILSVYVNEYISIYLSSEELQELVHANEAVFDNIEPFSEVVFWDLANGDVLSVRPSRRGAA